MSATNNPILDVLFARHHIRMAEHRGEHWLVAADVSKALGLAKLDDQVRNLPEKLAADTILMEVSDSRPTGTRCERKRGENLTRPMTILSPAAVMYLAMRSNKPEAIEFALWITDVLREIAKYGTYVSGSEPSERCSLLWYRYRLERQAEIAAANEALESQGLTTIALFRELNQVELRDVLSFGRHAAQCALEAKEKRTRVFTKNGMRRAYSDAVLKAALARLQPQLPLDDATQTEAVK